MAFDDTVGGANANSYASVADLDAYAAARLPAVSWFATATQTQKENALMAACRELDADFNWTGAAVDSTQALCWPRRGMVTRNGFAIATTEIPVDLKEAQCEFALQLGAGDRLGDNDAIKKGVTSLKAGSVALTFSDVLSSQSSTVEGADVAIRKQQSALNWVSDVVPAEVRRLLVPSWFRQPGIKRPFVFSAMGSQAGD